MVTSKSPSNNNLPRLPRPGADYKRTPLKRRNARRKDQSIVSLPLRDLRLRELQKRLDALDALDALAAQEREEQTQDAMPVDEAPIASSSNAADWEDLPDSHIHQVPTLPLAKRRQWPVIDKQEARAAKKRNLKEDAVKQYAAWTKLMPSLVKPLLDFLSKASGTPSPTSANIQACTTCDGQKTSRVLCLFWDRKPFVLSSKMCADRTT